MAIQEAVRDKVRDPRLDAVRGLLIFLVVVGHLLEEADLWTARSTDLPLTAIYLVHMPAFVLVAGATAARHHVLPRVLRLLVLLVTFEVVYGLVHLLLDRGPAFAPDRPYWLLWFLLALALWQLVTPLVLRHPRAWLAGSVLAALGAGTLPWVGYPVTVSRALVFLPFFVLGVVHGRRLIRWAGARPGLAVLGGLGLWLLGSVLLAQTVDNRFWFYGSVGYAALDTGTVAGTLGRAGLMAFSAVGTIVVLALCPVRPWLQGIGRRSLSVFVLHGLVVLAIGPWMPPLLARLGPAALPVILLLAAGITGVLAVPWIDRALRAYADAVTSTFARLVSSRRLRRAPVGR